MYTSALIRSLFIIGVCGSGYVFAQVPVTITSNVTGQSFTVAGTGCAAGGYTVPQTLQWTPGASCTVTFLSPYSVQLDTQYVFNSWQDGSPSNPRTFTAPSQATTYTANFTTQYYLTVQVNPQGGGTATGGGWYNQGSATTLNASPASGYRFVNWTGTSQGALTANPAVVSVGQPQTVVANFAPLTNPVPGNYTITTVSQSGYAAGINDFGQVAGIGYGYEAHPFLWTPSAANGILGSLVDLQGLPLEGNINNSVGGINNHGEVVGTTTNNSGGQVFLWSPSAANTTTGTITALSIPNGSIATIALNNFGQVGGDFNGSWSIWTPSIANGTTGTFTLTSSQLQGLVGMNTLGQAIMSNQCCPAQLVLFTPSSANGSTGSFTSLTGLAGASQSVLRAINDNGTIVGNSCITSVSGNCQNQGFVWTPSTPNGNTGTIAQIPLPTGFVSLTPTALNAQGDIVGTMLENSGTSVPFLYTSGVVYDLSTLSGLLVGAMPAGINAAGQIALSNSNAVYLATTSPPPAPSPNAIPVTITSNVTGQSFTVAGTGCAAGGYTVPQTLQWTPGASCTVTFLSPYSVQLDTQYVFNSWQDGSPSNPRTFTAPSQATTYTANFTTQYYLTVQVNPQGGGTATGGGWYNQGSATTLNASPASGYRFVNWTGTSQGALTANPAVVSVGQPQTVVANFAPLTNPVPGNYTITTVSQSGYAAGINDFGQVAGIGYGYEAHPFLWTPSAANGILGSLVDLQGLPLEGNINNSVGGINNHGEVVGTTTNNSGGQVFLWSPSAANTTTGTITALSIPNGSIATIALNNFGQVGGDFNGSWSIWTPSIANGTTGTFTLTSSQLQGLVGMNTLGQAIMSNQCCPAQLVLFTPSSANGSTGSFTSLTGLAGASQSVLRAINDNGTIVGNSCITSVSGNCQNQGFVWTPSTPNGNTGTIAQIPLPTGFVSLTPTALNAQGDIVGTMLENSGTSVPFLYTSGVVYDLSTLSGLLVGAMPAGINAAGQIALSNSNAVYLATPPVIVPPTAPFGHIDTPINDSTGIAGAIGVTGWALAYPVITNVGVWRETVPGETACVHQPGGDCLVFIGTATYVPGTRPDVARAYPGYPNNTGGWGLQVLTNELPNSNGQLGHGNGAYRIHAIATNTAGQSTDLGTVSITVNNAGSLAPFGTIDTPAPGATVSGTAYVNFGWVLTPQPNIIPLNGSTIWVYIDNLPVGHPVYNNDRSDISTLFPGLQNSMGAVGYYYIDTTQLANGLHTIAWTATDSAGHAVGLGSRYFTVQN